MLWLVLFVASCAFAEPPFQARPQVLQALAPNPKPAGGTKITRKPSDSRPKP